MYKEPGESLARHVDEIHRGNRKPERRNGMNKYPEEHMTTS